MNHSSCRSESARPSRLNALHLATLHLAKTYCAPAAMYGCETWYLERSDYHRLNIVWNNSFRRIFGCCWRESVVCLQFYCHTLPMTYMIDQRKILFWKKVLTSGIQVVATLAILNKGSIGMILSKYAIPSLIVSLTDIKNLMWRYL